MQLSHILLGLLAAGYSAALPYNGTQPINGTLAINFAQHANPSAKDVVCGPSDDQQKYTANQIKNAVKSAKKYWKNGVLDPNEDNFPHYYGASDPDVKKSLPEGCGAGVKKYEYPLKDDKGKKDMDRVVLGESSDKKQHFYCFTMTHRGLESDPQNKNGFKMCKEA